MEMSYKQVETALTSYLRIKPDRLMTFRSRIKQLQRLSFPPGVNIGRGVRMAYNAEHLYKYAIAFELMGVGFPAQFVVSIIRKHWKALATGFALAQINDLLHDNDPVFARLALRTMNDIQFGEYRDPDHTSITIEDRQYFEFANARPSESSPFCFPIIFLSSLRSRLVKEAQERAGVTQARFDDEVLGWRNDDTSWDLRFKGPYPDRSALNIRREMHRRWGNDPSALTPDAVDEAREFEDALVPIPF